MGRVCRAWDSLAIADSGSRLLAGGHKLLLMTHRSLPNHKWDSGRVSIDSADLALVIASSHLWFHTLPFPVCNSGWLFVVVVLSNI